MKKAKTIKTRTVADNEGKKSRITVVKDKPHRLTEQKMRGEKVSLTAALSEATTYKNFDIWLVGDTPLIVHAWSEKARREMLGKQAKRTRGGKEARDPEADFVASLYEMGEGKYGFPVTGVKNAIVSAAHKDKGVAREAVKTALWLNAEMVRTRPAFEKAICDMPLIRVYGSDPQMREDMVKIGTGLSKTANLAYRGQFTTWAMNITGEFNAAVITPESLAFLIKESGRSAGLGEWRNEKRGVFGAFHLGTDEEAKAWDDFRDNKNKLPKPFLVAAE